MMLAQQPQVVIRAVHDEFMRVQRAEQRGKIYSGQRINQPVAVGRADLDQADFFGIRVQAVGLGVERNPCRRAQFRQPRGELFVGFNHTANIFLLSAIGSRKSKLNAAHLDTAPVAQV